MQILHRDPVRVLRLAKIEYLSNIRMGNAGSYPSFIQKHVDELLIFDQVRVDLFDRYPLLKSSRTVHARKMDASHASNTDFVNNSVPAEEIGTFSGRTTRGGAQIETRLRGWGTSWSHSQHTCFGKYICLVLPVTSATAAR
jgi:hypothetical protein